MRSVIYSYKPKSARKRDAPDAVIEASAWDFGGTERDAPAGGGGSGGTTPKSSGLRQITADRPIFTLSVAADLLGLHPRTLRIYEEKGLVIPARTNGNRRRYSQVDIERFQAIRLLTRGGVNLEGVRIILEMAEELTHLGSDPTSIIERNLQTSD